MTPVIAWNALYCGSSFSASLTSTMFGQWKFFIELRQEERAEEMRCDVHHASTLLTRGFRQWVDYTQMRRWKSYANEQASALHRYLMCATAPVLNVCN